MTYEDTTIWLIEILLPSLPTAGQADTPAAAEPKRGRSTREPEVRQEAARLQQQEGRRYPTRAALSRAVMRRVNGAGAKEKTVYKHLDGFWVAPGLGSK